jgi:hypothetical protein
MTIAINNNADHVAHEHCIHEQTNTRIRTNAHLQKHKHSYTDGTGVVAFYEPGLMNRKVFFAVLADNYQFVSATINDAVDNDNKTRDATENESNDMHARGGIEFDPGVLLTTTQGGSATVWLRRFHPSTRRAFRLTGGSTQRDAYLVRSFFLSARLSIECIRLHVALSA